MSMDDSFEKAGRQTRTEGTELARKDSLANIAENYNMSVSDLSGLRITKMQQPADEELTRMQQSYGFTDPVYLDTIEGNVNGVSVKVEHLWGNAEDMTYGNPISHETVDKATVDGKMLSREDAHVIWEHLKGAIYKRDEINNHAIENSLDAIDVQQYQNDIVPLRDKLLGLKPKE